MTDRRHFSTQARDDLYPGAAHSFSARARHHDPVNETAWEISSPQALAFAKATLAH